jgi:hypothetical protein
MPKIRAKFVSIWRYSMALLGNQGLILETKSSDKGKFVDSILRI